MIITRTPYRISLFGGGSDYPSYFEKYGGAVLGTTIDKYCFVTYRDLPPFFAHKNRIVYSNVEHCQSVDDIKHPGVRETLRWLNVNGVEIHHDGDLPGRSGTGSSSAFVVGLLNAIHSSKGRAMTARQLAMEAYHVEKELANEVVGYQDQILTAYGGFRHIKFINRGFEVVNHRISTERIAAVMARIMLVFTGETRNSSPIAASYLKLMDKKNTEMRRVVEMVDEAIDVLEGYGDLDTIGRLLDESWTLKKRRGIGISTSTIDVAYATALAAGAIGGKMIGAGGAGFMIIYSEPDIMEYVTSELSELGCLIISFKPETDGSKVIYNDQQSQY